MLIQQSHMKMCQSTRVSAMKGMCSVAEERVSSRYDGRGSRGRVWGWSDEQVLTGVD